MTKHICRVCKADLTDVNWYPSLRKRNRYICKMCINSGSCERNRLWRKANPDKVKEYNTRAERKRGRLPMEENKECALFLGVHVAERVLSHVFKDVERMPINNPGYDFICNRGKMIDVKSSCIRRGKNWIFRINYNTVADYFLCLAFDNRVDLNPMHIWLLPSSVAKHRSGVSICINTISKWDEYRLDISKVSTCCDLMRV